ncbi:MAG TPA: hypothetical protein PL138_07180 [Bacillota bacterium]|nr:hypothetical protein [Bacillota bacterium]
MHFFDSGAIRKLDEIEVVLKEKTNSYLKQMTQTYFEEIDQAIADDKTGGRS